MFFRYVFCNIGSGFELINQVEQTTKQRFPPAKGCSLDKNSIEQTQPYQ